MKKKLELMKLNTCSRVGVRFFLGVSLALSPTVVEMALPGVVWAESLSGNQGNGRNEPLAGNIGGEASPDQVFLGMLLDRGLFRLAELHCRERLASESLVPAVRAEMTIELIRVLQECALCVAGSEKEELETRIQGIYEDFRKAEPACPWALTIDFQYAVGVFARARRLEMEARFALDPEERMETAREALRDAISRFLDVDSRREAKVLELAQNGASQPGKGTGKRKKKDGKKDGGKESGASFGVRQVSRFSEDGLSLWELESLKLNVQYQLLLAYELQALTYPEGSLDRLTSLKEAQSRARGLTMMPSNSGIYWNARLAEIRCFRLQGDFSGAEKRVDFLKKQAENMPEAVRLELTAELIRLALAEKKVSQALEIVKSELHADIIGKNGELDCAILELWLAQWADALENEDENEKENADATKFREEAVGILNEIRAKSAPWWVRRAEIEFDGMLKNTGSTENISFLKMVAENACANQDTDAERACERLWNAAVTQKDSENALYAGRLAAAYCYQNGKMDAASVWFRKMALTFPDNDVAIEEHARAIAVTGKETAEALEKARGKAVGEGKIDAELDALLDRYQVLLLEHFQRFGKKDPKYLDFLCQLAQVAEIRGNLAVCVDVSMVIVANSPAESEARAVAEVECFENWRRYLESLKQGVTTEYLKALFTAVQWVETLPPSEARARGSFFFLCALESCHAELNGNSGEDLEGDSEENVEPDTRKTALRKKILKAEKQLFEGMKPFLETFPEEIREEAEQIGTFALLSSGNPAEAFPFYEKFAQKFPNRREVQLTWGRLLADKALAEGTESRKNEALEQWRRVESRVEERSTEWYEAKYWIIRFQLELGEKQLAGRLLRTFRTLNPDLGGEKWRGKFEELAQMMEEK